jgi:hypothetical protein
MIFRPLGRAPIDLPDDYRPQHLDTNRSGAMGDRASPLKRAGLPLTLVLRLGIFNKGFRIIQLLPLFPGDLKRRWA